MTFQNFEWTVGQSTEVSNLGEAPGPWIALVSKPDPAPSLTICTTSTISLESGDTHL